MAGALALDIQRRVRPVTFLGSLEPTTIHCSAAPIATVNCNPSGVFGKKRVALQAELVSTIRAIWADELPVCGLHLATPEMLAQRWSSSFST
jgi:hypothetical protein